MVEQSHSGTAAEWNVLTVELLHSGAASWWNSLTVELPFSRDSEQTVAVSTLPELPDMFQESNWKVTLLLPYISMLLTKRPRDAVF